MRYLTIILLFFAFGANAQCIKYVNGIQVQCTQQEVADFTRNAFVADSIAKDSTNVQKERIEKRISTRQDKLLKAYAIVIIKMNKTNSDAFVSATRQERSDYPYNPDLLINWVVNTFPTKSYFDAALQTKILNILQ